MHCTQHFINATPVLVMIIFKLIIMAGRSKSRASKKRGLRSSNSHRIDILSASPGEQHLEINGIKLPTYEQVLLCYMATMEKFRNEDGSKNCKLTTIVSQAVFQKVKVHYHKANIPTKAPNKCLQGIMKINNEFKSVNKWKNKS